MVLLFSWLFAVKSLLILSSTPENMMVSGEAVDLNGGAADAEGEVVEGVAGVRLEVVTNVWSCVEAGC